MTGSYLTDIKVTKLKLFIALLKSKLLAQFKNVFKGRARELMVIENMAHRILPYNPLHSVVAR